MKTTAAQRSACHSDNPCAANRCWQTWCREHKRCGTLNGAVAPKSASDLLRDFVYDFGECATAEQSARVAESFYVKAANWIARSERAAAALSSGEAAK